MTRLRGHFDGQAIVLDEPAPPGLEPNTPVEIVVPDERERALQEWQTFVKDWWSRPLTSQVLSRSWKREDLYERGGRPLS